MKLFRITGITLLALTMMFAFQQTQAAAAPSIVSNPPAVPPATGAATRLSSQLYQLVQMRSQIIARGGLDTVTALSALAVDVTPRTGVSFAALTAAINSVGGIVERQNIDSIRAHLSAPAILALAAKPETLVIDQAAAEAPGPLFKAVQQSGVTDAGVHAINADAWQAVNWQGAGVNVAIFDTDFTGIEDNYGGSGVGPYECVKGTHTFTTDGTVQGHTGRTIGSEEAQAVCATAPLANVYVVRLNGASEMVSAMTYLHDLLNADNGRKLNIILSGMTTTRPQGPGDNTAPDLSPALTFDTSPLPDGSNTAIASATNQGILWINAAGDFRNAHWSGPEKLGNIGAEPFFTPASGPAVTTNTFTWVKAGGPITVMLRWSGNWASGVQFNDLDLTMSCKDSSNNVFNVQSTNNQDSGNYPFPRESVTFPDPNAQTPPVSDSLCTIQMLRKNLTGPTNYWIDLYVLSSQVNLQYKTGSLSQAVTTSLAAEENAFSVGSFCTATFQVDGTSSYGPFNNQDMNGSPVPASTQKPDLVGPSAVSNTFHTTSNCSTGFYGSASGAAHIAGEAAIYWGYLGRGGTSPSAATVKLQLQANNQNPNAASTQVGIGGGVAYMASVPTSLNAGTTTPTSTAAPTRTRTPSPTPTNTGIPTGTPTSNAALIETVAMYRQSNHTFYIRFSNSSGAPDISIAWGSKSTYGVAGDWDGDGLDTIGIYDQKTGVFNLSDSNRSIAQSIPAFAYGIPGDQPIVGKWLASATHDGVGVFRPSNGLIYLTQKFITAYADAVVVLGIPNDVGLGGHWLTTNNFLDTAGVYRPNNSFFYLTNANCPTNACIEYGDEVQIFGAPFDTPLTGDWFGTGHTGIGIYRVSSGVFYLKNDISNGPPNFAFAYGAPGDIPLAGHWKTGNIPPPPPIIPISSATATRSPVPSITATNGGGSFDG